MDYFLISLLAIGYFVYWIFKKYYLPKIKGKQGERIVAQKLRRLNKKRYFVFNDEYFISNENSIQIDHLIISVYGIFVIETKNYKGWIHGAENSNYWKQTFIKKKHKFFNPIKQNRIHIYALRHILSSFGNLTFHPIVVFTGKAKLKNVFATSPVIYKKHLLSTIRNKHEIVLTDKQVERIVAHIKKTKSTDRNRAKSHLTNIKQSALKRKESKKHKVCPRCGGDLILRKGKFGAFFGCSNYPACKFSMNR